ncbi:TonB-dependent receptor [Acinetobacter sp. 194]|nr:TonB-dependent receptor [Acinetobacter shaoyimingii]
MVFQRSILAVCVGLITAHAFADVPSDSQRLETIVVSASLAEQDLTKAPASISVVTAEDIEKSAATNIAEVLNREAGVYNYNSGQDKIIIRGMQDTSGSYTLILVNGKRTTSSGAMWRGNDFDWSSIPLNSIERIEVIRGPMSSLYGSDAMGGVINIITKKGEVGQLNGQVFTQFNRAENGEGKNQHRYGFNLRGGLTDQLSFNLSGDVYHRDAWNRPGSDPEEYYFVEKDTQNIQGALTWDVNDQQSLDLDLTYNKDKRPLTRDSLTSWQAMEMERTNIGITHRGNWSWGKTEAYIGKESGKIDDYDSEYDNPQQRHYKQDNLNARLFTNFNWLNNNMTVGSDYKKQEITDKVSYLSGGTEQENIGVFVQNDTHINDRLTLTLGGRYDDYDNFDGKFTGKGYLSYEIADGIVAKGGFGQAYKVPSAYQLNYDYNMVSCGGTCKIRGNPDLEAEESTNYEASLLIKRQNWNAGVTLFQNEVDNLISRVSLAKSDPRYEDLFPNIWENISEAKIKGVELTGGYNVNDKLNFKANATYLDAKDVSKPKKVDLTERPEWMANLAVNWEPVNNFRVVADANYIGKQTLNANTGKELGGYTLYNLAFSSNLSQNLKLDYGIKNLSDVDLEDKDEDFNTRVYGRNYFAKLAYSF